MKPYADYTRSERCAEYAALQEQYEAWTTKQLSLNMARGKPSRAQLDMVSGILRTASTARSTCATMAS